jgi:hypothetical protein
MLSILIVKDKQMAELRLSMTRYTQTQQKMHQKSLNLSAQLKQFSDSEATQLRGVLSTFSEAIRTLEGIRKQLNDRVLVNACEPLKVYSVS